MNRKYYYFLIGFILILFGIGKAGYDFYIKSPIADMDFTNCSIGVYNYTGEEILEYLNEEQRDEFVSILEKANLKGIAKTHFPRVTGVTKRYRVFLENGSEFDLSFVLDYLVVGKRGYVCESETRGKLEEFADEVFRKHYPVSRQQ